MLKYDKSRWVCNSSKLSCSWNMCAFNTSSSTKSIQNVLIFVETKYEELCRETFCWCWLQWDDEKCVYYCYIKFHDVAEALYNIDYDFRNVRILDSSGVIEKEPGKVFKTSFHVIFDEVHFVNIEKWEHLSLIFFDNCYSSPVLIKLFITTVNFFVFLYDLKWAKPSTPVLWSSWRWFSVICVLLYFFYKCFSSWFVDI